jgi:hypothetical protein
MAWKSAWHPKNTGGFSFKRLVNFIKRIQAEIAFIHFDDPHVVKALSLCLDSFINILPEE